MPADFSEPEVKWLEGVAGAKATLDKDMVLEKQREDLLADILKDVDLMRDDLAEAQKFTVKLTKEQQILFWKTTKVKTMNWSEANATKPKVDVTDKKRNTRGVLSREDNMRDAEVDTKHDLRGNYEVDPAAAKKAQEAHQKIVELQEKMRALVDDEGNRLFDDDMIERELWTPLVKADVIPENAVADGFSEESKVFKGAVKIYEDKLKEHSKTAGRHETAKRMLGIGKKTVAMMGKVAGEAIKIANFSGVAMSGQEGRELKALTDQGAEGGDTIPGGSGKTFDELSKQFNDSQKALEQQAYASMALGLIDGGFDLADKALDKPDKKRNWEIAEIIFNSVANAAIAGLAADKAKKTYEANSTSDFRTANAAAGNLVKYGLQASKVIFRLHDALVAPPGERTKHLKAMVVAVGTAVGNAIAAFDVAETRDKDNDNVINPGTDGAFSNAGAYVTVAIVGAANIGEMLKIIKEASDEGKKPNAKAFATALGLNVVGAIMAGTYVPAADGSREVLKDDQTNANPHQETEYEKSYRKLGDGDQILSMTEGMKGLSDLFDKLPVDAIDPARMEKQILKAAQEEEEARLKADLDQLNTRLQNDEDFRKQFEADIANETKERKAELQKLIGDATASPDDLADEKKAKEAMAAIDRLIAEVEATRMKIAVIEQVTSGGVGIIAKFLPAAGLAVAIRQFISDLYFLAVKVKELNLWNRNMALTYGNDSVYGPAIQSRLASAEIQLSQKTINAALSAAGVAAESMRLADVMGAATATSIGITMAKALSDYAYEMHKEIEISKGWSLYLKARENPGDRKIARKAMRWNSTLSKCVLAYGIVVARDPVAKAVAQNCGLTPVVVADKDDLCQKVVQYFMTVYNDDPVVLRSIPLERNWHPGKPDLTLESWLRFKAAAFVKAVPPISERSADTARIDSMLADLDKLWSKGGYAPTRDDLAGDDPTDEDYGDFLEESLDLAEALMNAFSKYTPQNGPAPKDAEDPWTEGALHSEMRAVTESLAARAQILKSEIGYDIKLREAAIKEADDEKLDLLRMMEDGSDEDSSRDDSGEEDETSSSEEDEDDDKKPESK